MSKKIPQTKAELEEHLADQVHFLQSSANSFDSGYGGEAKRLAIALRVLLYDRGQSRSLLGQLGRLNAQFISTNIPFDERNAMAQSGLITMAMGDSNTEYSAPLDKCVCRRWLPFAQWWGEIVFADDRKDKLSRMQLVLAVANQDGGGHVDPALDEIYARLSRHNSMGWQAPIPKPERAAIRQITHEVLATLHPEYKCACPNPEAVIFAGAAIHLNTSVAPTIPKPPKIGRNELCPCGSGRKFKRCHGAVA